MRKRLFRAASVAMVIAWLSLAFAVQATDSPRDNISKLIAAADISAAEALASAQLAQTVERSGADSLDAAFWYNQKGIIAQARGQYADALSLFSRALGIRRNRLGLRHAATTIALNNVALMEERTGRYRDAMAHFTLAYRINVGLLGPRHGQSVTNLSNIGLLNLTLGRIRLAQGQLETALEATAIPEGWWSDNTATALSNLAALQVTAFHFEEAERLLRHALSIDEYRHGVSHPNVAITLNNLGELYRLQGKPVEAEQVYLRAAAIDRPTVGAASPGYAIDLLNLATLYEQTGRLNDARASLDAAMAIYERAAPRDAEVSAAAQSELAHILLRQGRCAEAAPLLQKASARISAAFGRKSAASLQGFDDLAMLHACLGDRVATARDLRQYVRGAEATFGKDSPVAVRATLRFALALADAGQRAEARALAVRLQGPVWKAFGHRSIDAAHLWFLKARLSFSSGQLHDANRNARNSLRLYRLWLSPNAPQLALAHDLLSRSHLRQGNWRQAVAEGERALQIIMARRRLTAKHRRMGGSDEIREARAIVRNTLATAIEASHHMRSTRSTMDTALEAAELLSDDGQDRAVAFGALKRRALGTGSLPLLHRQSLLLTNLQDLDEISSLALADDTFTSALQARRQSIRKELVRIDGQLQHALPRYARLMDRHPVTPADMRRQMGKGEVLLYILPEDGRTIVLAMTKDACAGHVVDLPAADLLRDVTRLRTGLDPEKWTNAFEPFDRTTAYRLYQQLLQPLSPLLRTSRTLLVVTATPLDVLPIGVLVNAPPPGGSSGDSSPEALRATSWLGSTFGIVQIPSASALGELRSTAGERNAPDLFLGIAPLTAPTRVGQLTLPVLKSTEPELQRLSAAIGGGNGRLLLGRDATQDAFRRANPGRKRVIAFATHALSSRQSGLGEPALVMSRAVLPEAPDDGLLTASEVAAMDLAADWVILSGCNTAGDGADSASTLARAFALAGARSLLVSHWPVSDRAASQMTTSTLENYRARPMNGQAEALRRAMASAIADRSHPLNAHPTTWAAFSLIGEFAPRRAASPPEQ